MPDEMFGEGPVISSMQVNVISRSGHRRAQGFRQGTGRILVDKIRFNSFPSSLFSSGWG